MTITKAQLDAEIDAQFPTNNTKAISAQKLRGVLDDMVTYTYQQETAIASFSATGILDLQLTVDALINVPPQAAAVGYNLPSFTGTFDTNQVDINNSKTSGFKFYPYNFFQGSGHTDLSALVLNSDTSITLMGDTTGPNGELATAVQTGGGNFIGTAFGGGAYFEYIMKFNPADVPSSGTPALWSMTIEHLALQAAQNWPGQAANYDHFSEVDTFEFYRPLPSNYLGTIHDWFGVSSSYNDINNGGSSVRSPSGPPDFTQYHKYGMLWVPATASLAGYVKFYFDDAQQGLASVWRQYTNQPPPSLVPVFDVSGSTTGDFVEDASANHRQLLSSSLLGGSPLAGNIVITVRMTVGGIDSMWIGHAAAAGNPYDFDGNQVQVKFGGNAGLSAQFSALTSSDPVPFTYDPTKNLVISWYSSSVPPHVRYKSPLVGATTYDAPAAANESNVTVALQSYTPSASECDLVIQIDVEEYSIYSILDKQHLVPIMGTGPGAPITVKSVKIWQDSTANNLIF